MEFGAAITAAIIQISPNLCSLICNKQDAVVSLKDGVDLLEKDYKLLECKCSDMETERREASRNRGELTTVAKAWIEQVQNIKPDVDSIISIFRQMETDRNACVSDCLSCCKLRMKVIKNLKEVERLRNRKSDIDPVIFYFSRLAVEMRTASFAVQRTYTEKKDQILNHLQDNSKSVICVYGMGGIGKTALMKDIHNTLMNFPEFKDVIWVTLPRDPDLKSIQAGTLESIQKEIMGKAGMDFDDRDHYSVRSEKLRVRLGSTRYVLILDDLWEEISLENVGIPKPDDQNRSKIVITTREADLGRAMSADVFVTVTKLEDDEAWDLFVAHAGEVVKKPHIEDIAEEVAKKCDGLPLAIKLVAVAMKEKDDRRLWESTLRDFPPELYSRLKLSYDYLDAEVKMCFLYCLLFPNNYEISVNDLVRLWIMEELIDIDDNLMNASNKGHRIVEILKDRCLLEEGTPYFKGEIVCKKYVKMHDVIREMARSIASQFSNNGRKFMIKAGLGLKVPQPYPSWAERGVISFMRNEITELLPPEPNCQNLVSLFLRDNPITGVPSCFFEHMPRLRVLDLTSTPIKSLKVSASSLSSLRALILKKCKKLRDLQFSGDLKELQFLDLSYSGIRSLSLQMQALENLKKLNVSKLEDNFVTIPSNMISKLSRMEDLRMMRTKVNWAKTTESQVAITLGEIAGLVCLTTLKIWIHDVSCVECVSGWPWSNLRKFKICIGPFDSMENLPCEKQVHIHGGNNCIEGVKEIATHAEGLMLQAADVEHLSQLVSDSKRLKVIHILKCEKVECIIDWRHIEDNALQHIRELNLRELPQLEKLFEGELSQGRLRELRKLTVTLCKKLRSLFSSKMIQNFDKLETLDVNDCEEIEEIIEGSEDLPETPFPKLRSLRLYQLIKLRSIIRRPAVTLPSLKDFRHPGCPVLKLPKCPNMTRANLRL